MSDVSALVDEVEIKNLSHRYAIALDKDDREEWASLFSDDVVIESAGSQRGLEDVLRIPRDQLARYKKTFHSVTTQKITLSGDEATGEVYCVAHHMYEDHHQGGRLPFDLSHNFVIRYEDAYARIAGRWVFTRRRIVTEARFVDQIIPGVAADSSQPSGF